MENVLNFRPPSGQEMTRICRDCHRTGGPEFRLGLCGRCYSQLCKAGPHYCPECGQEVAQPVRRCYWCRCAAYDFYGQGQLPAAPTLARPGTAEKVLVLIERVQRRECPWHPQDGGDE